MSANRDPAASPIASRAGRPVLRHSSLSGGSYIHDHQQYRPSALFPLTPTSDITTNPAENAEIGEQQQQQVTTPGFGVGKKAVRDSGIVHSIFGNSLVSLPADTPKVVATLFYKPSGPGAPEYPTSLDHLYGSYVSQLCLTNFLQVMESLSTPYQRISSSHRCLDREDQPRVVEVTISPPPNPEYLTFDEMRKHESIWQFERQWSVEVVLQRESVFRRHKRLAVFDMDSTLIQQEVIDEIARDIGVEEQVSAITERAMNGELDFSASLEARVKLLKGVSADIFERLKSVITISPGARDLCLALKRLGFKLAVLSGGFQPLAEWLAGELGIDYAFANLLEIDPTTQTLTGNLVSGHPIVDSSRKLSLLRDLALSKRVPLSQTIAVGDGANDLPMLGGAGLGVAWRAKQKVQQEAPARLNGESMLDVLYLMGLDEGEIRELLA